MNSKRIWSFLMVLFLMAGSVRIPVQAKTGTLESESVTLTDKNRYNPEYYGKPEVYYPDAKKRMSKAAGTGQTLEEYVVAALENFEETIDVSAYHVPKDTAAQEYFKILNNNPQLFYVKGACNCSFYVGEDTIFSYTVTYLYEKETAISMREELEAAADEAVSRVDTSMDAYQQALTVHDYLVLNCEYDKENLDAGQVPDISNTAYGSLVKGTAVCDGYADGFSYIMKNKLGIPCEVISSNTMEHAWNMIQIGGKWYHVDATWDDPVWDCIGRVGHDYFLLSDSEIADIDHNHSDWSADHTADSTDYDNAFWADINSAICYANGAWYYSKYQEDEQAVKLVKKDGDQLLADREEVVYTAASRWENTMVYYPASYMYLAKVGNIVYFNTPTEIYQVNTDGTVERFYSPADLSDMLIYGFTVRENESEYEFWYAPNSTPSLTDRQTFRKHTLPRIPGITAANVRGDYTGQPYTINVNGVQEGDTVQYALADGRYQSVKPEMINAGTYEVHYQVERDGYATFFGDVTVTIEQAVPQYELPTGLRGYIGDALSSVELPDGFTWQNPDTVLREEGNQAYQATYTPEDSENYRTVSVDAAVEVTCPGHQYDSVITRAATETQKGLKTYTCKLCYKVYTEEIDMLSPAMPSGVSGLKITKRTTNSLSFSWKEMSGVSYRLMFYKGSKLISTKFVTENACTYKKLKPAAIYTLRITPYRIVNGQKIFANAAGSIKTAASPAKAKLSKAKRTGGGKVKLTWKRVAGASGYEIFMKTGKGKYKKIKTVGNGKTLSFTKTKLSKKKGCSFRIRAYTTVDGKKVYGADSNVKKVK